MQQSPDSLKGQILIAMPGMSDPRFDHSVIYLCAHSDEGAMGLILNKPASDLDLTSLMEQIGIKPTDKMRKMQIRYELPIVMGFDAGDPGTGSHPTTMVNYRTGGTPWAVLISPDGYVLYNDFGMDGDNAIRYISAEIEKLG